MSRVRLLAAAAAALVIIAVSVVSCGRNGNGSYQGWIEANLIFVGPEEIGRIEVLNVREGDIVTKGSPLFSLERWCSRPMPPSLSVRASRNS